MSAMPGRELHRTAAQNFGRSAPLTYPHHAASAETAETAARNLQGGGGFAEEQGPSIGRHRLLSSIANARGVFSLPKDYIHRRRAIRRISNVLLIVGLSAAAGYVLTRPTGGTGFRPPKNAVLAGQPSADASLPSAAAASANGITPEGYKLAAGPYATEELSDLVVHDLKRNKDIHFRLFYPSSGGSFPVIIFPHGAGGSQYCCDA